MHFDVFGLLEAVDQAEAIGAAHVVADLLFLLDNGGAAPGLHTQVTQLATRQAHRRFIQKVINKIIVFGSVYLGIVALLPIIAGNLMEGVKNLAIGGTSVIIVVGVALETVKQMEAQMLMRHYKGFLE